MLEDARLPVVGEARKSVQKGEFSGIRGVTLGVMIALLVDRWTAAGDVASDATREFSGLLDEATPRFRKGVRR